MRGLTAQRRIGSFDQLVAFPDVTYSSDEYGGVIAGPSLPIPISWYRANVEELSAKEDTTDTPQAKVTKMIRVTMRSLGDANPDHHKLVRWNTEMYNIINITLTQRQRFMIIDARIFDHNT